MNFPETLLRRRTRYVTAWLFVRKKGFASFHQLLFTRDWLARAEKRMLPKLRIPPRRLLVAALVSSSLSRLNPAFAAPASRFESLLVAQAKLKLVNELVADPARWPEVEAMLKAPPLENSALSKAFEAVVDPPTAKDRLMDQAAFIVYYEEVRYNDRRLEPQTPSRRATQNGLKREVLRAVADELAEVSFLVQQKAGIADADDLRMYLTTAEKALDEFLMLSGASTK